MSALRSIIAAAVVAGTVVLGSAGTASAADGSIAHVEPTSEGLQILVSVPAGAEVELDDVSVTINDTDADAVAVPAETSTLVQRTAVLAIDTSRSMRGPRFRAAKEAALAYLDGLPDDVLVGIVSFAGRGVLVARADPGPRRRPCGDRGPGALRGRRGSTTASSRRSTWPATTASARCSSSPTAPTPAPPRSRTS